MNTKCLDTNILIELLSQGNFQIDFNAIISRITYIEFLSFDQLVEPEVVEEFREILNSAFSIIEISEEIADFAAYIRRTVSGIKLGDALILSTAILNESELLTKDKKLIKYYNKVLKIYKELSEK